MRVAVAGASGYAGGELLRLIAGHPRLELVLATADTSAGKTIGEVHRGLAGHARVGGVVLEAHHAVKQVECDLVFLALPSGRSAAVAGDLAQDVKVVDLGADFRLSDAGAWARHYGGEHAGRWVTGLPELPGARSMIKGAAKVAAPGCYATAAIVGLAPLVSAGLVDVRDIVVVAASGTSGAGKSLRAELLGSEVMGSVSAYQAGGTHRHTPEIEQALRELGPSAGDGTGAGDGSGAGDVRVSFTPLLVPMPRGILATATARLTEATSTNALRQALISAYQDEPFIYVLPEGEWPATAAVAGSNGVHLQVAADERAGRAVVIAAIDNLGKGAAGQAIQNANLMLCLPETAGLTSIGVAP